MCKSKAEGGRRCYGHLSQAAGRAKKAYVKARTDRASAVAAAARPGAPESAAAAAVNADSAYQSARYKLMDARLELAAGSRRGEADLQAERDDLARRAQLGMLEPGQSARDAEHEVDDLDGSIEMGRRERKVQAAVKAGVHISQAEELPDGDLDRVLARHGITNP